MRSKLGKKLRELRESANLGIKTAAPLAKVSYSYLSKIENGHRKPNEQLVEKLCAIYGKNKDEILVHLGKLPDDIVRIIEENGNQVFEFLRKNFREEN